VFLGSVPLSLFDYPSAGFSDNDAGLMAAKPFKKVLVANRGEIAVRVTRTLHEMGIRAVAVHSDVDRAALHVRMADEAYLIGPAPAGESYLRIEKVIDVAKRSGCDAIHPGYGFLSENPAFPAACEAAGITFIGPPASAMRQMGSKTAARAKMAEAGVPIVPGASCDTAEEATAAAKKIGFPVMLKASSGGGGKGMRLVSSEAEMANAWERARSEAKKFFGDDTVYLEKAITRPRHVEIQVLGDRDGNMVHVFERDCSIQRRNQKVVEETPSPSPAATRELIAKMGAIAVQGAKAVGYHSAGTFEFLLAEDGNFYFLEMNTRLQVEHPVTELITGLDLVREMILVAQGEKLGFVQSDLVARGAAIQCRIYAEDPARGFLPSPGKIERLSTPAGPGIRDDSGVYPGAEVSSFYDPLISKLCVWAPTRERAVMRMRRALSEYIVTGIRTNLAFHEKLFQHPDFVAGNYDTGFIERNQDELLGYPQVPEADRDAVSVAIAIAAARLERATGAHAAETGETGSRLSPWVAQHRARVLR
jgi:acetyl-CoA carboxylase, biotin carboxylase subunit